MSNQLERKSDGMEDLVNKYRDEFVLNAKGKYNYENYPEEMRKYVKIRLRLKGFE